MDEDILVSQFNKDLDDILEGKCPEPHGDTSREYTAALDLAGRLKENNFVSESTRLRLRQHMSREYSSMKKESFMNRIIAKRKPALMVGTAAAVILLAVALALPGNLAAVAKDSIARTFKIGKYVTVIQEPDQAPGSLPGEPPKDGTILPDGSVLRVGSEEPAETVYYSSLAEAQKVAGFKILTPGYLPAGYTFKEAKGLGTYADYMQLVYDGNGKEISIIMTKMSEQNKFEVATNGQVEQVDINGGQGTWSEPNNVMWEKDDVNYSLDCSPGLGRAEAVKIAESIK
ncbi:MAG: DUF4367 domain-containing protein [Syntrophomonas sp.]